MDTNNGNFIKSITREQANHLFLDIPMRIHDHNYHHHHQTHTNIFPFQEFTVAKNQTSSQKGFQVIASTASSSIPGDNSYQTWETKMKNATKEEEEGDEDLGAIREMMFKIAAMQPLDKIDEATIWKPRRRNVRISDDPQSVAARRRRERISEKMRILQRIIPGGTKMDTASMLDETICYVKFLKRQIRHLQANRPPLPQPQPQPQLPTRSLFQDHAA